MVVDPSGCRDKIIDIHGAAGREWLERLPETMSETAARWNLLIHPPFDDLSYNYVAPATATDGRDLVVKAGVPSLELTQEIEALRVFDGNGIARLVDADADKGVLLLERLLPGEPLADIQDDERLIRAAGSVVQLLRASAPQDHAFASVAGWAVGLTRLRSQFAGGCGPFPPDLVETAEGLFTDLLDPADDRTLIHGDFHPQNILGADRERWLSIDPKGVVGSPMYDIAVLVTSMPRLSGESDRIRFLSRRVDQLAEELNLDRRLVVEWGLAHSVMSGWWSFEDHGKGWEWAFEQAGLLDSMRRR